MLFTKPAIRATRSAELMAAVLPVVSRYCVYGACVGCVTVTLGGGGATYSFFSPHAASANTESAMATKTLRIPASRQDRHFTMAQKRRNLAPGPMAPFLKSRSEPQ